MTQAQKKWIRELLRLCRVERATQWQIGDRYLRGKQSFGAQWCSMIVSSPEWKGHKVRTLGEYASVCRAFPKPSRYLEADFGCYQQAAALHRADPKTAIRLLRQAERMGWNENHMRQAVRQIRHYLPLLGGTMVDDLADLIGKQRKYRGILCDPPWDWERVGGMRGVVTYPTMSIDELCKLPVQQVAADDAFCFLWCAASGFEELALPLLRAWGFKYRTHAVWDKGSDGVGYYWRMAHENLLLGVRPNSPTHFMDHTMSSLIRAGRGKQQSEKPDQVHEIVERAIGGPYLEMFGRSRRQGWDVLGNQLAPQDNNPQLLAAD